MLLVERSVAAGNHLGATANKSTEKWTRSRLQMHVPIALPRSNPSPIPPTKLTGTSLCLPRSPCHRGCPSPAAPPPPPWRGPPPAMENSGRAVYSVLARKTLTRTGPSGALGAPKAAAWRGPQPARESALLKQSRPLNPQKPSPTCMGAPQWHTGRCIPCSPVPKWALPAPTIHT